MPQLIHFICSHIILIVFNSAISAKEQTLNEKPITPIERKWEGNFSQGELATWHHGEILLWQNTSFSRGNLLGEELPLITNETKKKFYFRIGLKNN